MLFFFATEHSTQLSTEKVGMTLQQGYYYVHMLPYHQKMKIMSFITDNHTNYSTTDMNGSHRKFRIQLVPNIQD